MNPYSVQTFDLYPLRFCMLARKPFPMPRGRSSNLVRGRFGMALREGHAGLYQRWFAPRRTGGPSGLLDSPRAFVLRVRHLEGTMMTPGQRYEIGLNLFDTSEPKFDVIGEALGAGLLAECTGFAGAELLRLPLQAAAETVSRVRVHFLSPTELKPADQPEFGVLLARIRDRVSTLRALYGAGPLEIDFQAMGERARAIRMTRWEMERVERERVSRSTGQRHSIGGFTGVAEYEGELAEFVPYLEIARWTGVGRQTVWGKGELAWETF